MREHRGDLGKGLHPHGVDGQLRCRAFFLRTATGCCVLSSAPLALALTPHSHALTRPMDMTKK